jgi:hypothetical protein
MNQKPKVVFVDNVSSNLKLVISQAIPFNALVRSLLTPFNGPKKRVLVGWFKKRQANFNSNFASLPNCKTQKPINSLNCS